jgi:hypothetical protein
MILSPAGAIIEPWLRMLSEVSLEISLHHPKESRLNTGNISIKVVCAVPPIPRKYSSNHSPKLRLILPTILSLQIKINFTFTYGNDYGTKVLGSLNVGTK